MQHIGKRQIHVVAAKQNVLSNADAFEFQGASVVGDGNQAEIGGPAAHVTNQNEVTRADQGTPVLAGLRDPGVERRLWLLEQCDFTQTRSLGGLGGQASCDFIERCGNGHDNLRFGEVPSPSLARVRRTGIRSLGAQDIGVSIRTERALAL